MKNLKKVIQKFFLICVYLIIMVNLQSCLSTAIPKIFNFAGRDLSKQIYEEARKSTEEAISNKIIENGKKDFSSIEPIVGIGVEISVEYDPYSYPYCDKVYENVPEIQRGLEICKSIRNAETCELYYTQETDNKAFEFYVFLHDQGRDVYLISNLLDYSLFVNGKCRLRTK